MSSQLIEIAGQELEAPERFGEILAGGVPVLIRGLVQKWPVVRAASRSPRDLKRYLAAFDIGAKVEVFLGEPVIAGKFYYNADFKGFNFERRTMPYLDAMEAVMEALNDPQAQAVYVGSVPASECLPGFISENPLPFLPPEAKPRIWLGTASNVSSHFDTFDNVACVIAGRRRFTLYAPEMIGSLYPGPVDNTMSGATVSLAASAAQGDEAKFPKFEQIRDQALVAQLEAGDALYLPKLWWHQVEGTAPFNGLVNYWWDAFSQGPDAPYTSLLFALITIAERPAAERRAWKALFDHYVFRTNGHPLAHMDPEHHGVLGPLRPHNYGRLRARVLRMLRAI